MRWGDEFRLVFAMRVKLVVSAEVPAREAEIYQADLLKKFESSVVVKVCKRCKAKSI